MSGGFKVKDLVLRFIAMPMAVQVFKQDKEQFRKSKAQAVYLDLIDSVLEKLQEDFNQLKSDMYTKYHLDVKSLGKSEGKVKYSVNKQVIEFTSDELKNKTEELMREYLANVELKSWERARDI